MKCQLVRELFPLYLDRALPGDEHKAVEAHVASCAACQSELALFKQTWETLGQWPDIAPRKDFVAAFWEKMPARPEPWYSRFGKFFSEAVLNKPLAAGLAVACLTIVVGSFILNSFQGGRQSDKLVGGLSQESLDIVNDIDLTENYEIIQDLEFFQDLDIIENMQTRENPPNSRT